MLRSHFGLSCSWLCEAVSSTVSGVATPVLADSTSQFWPVSSNEETAKKSGDLVAKSTVPPDMVDGVAGLRRLCVDAFGRSRRMVLASSLSRSFRIFRSARMGQSTQRGALVDLLGVETLRTRREGTLSNRFSQSF